MTEKDLRPESAEDLPEPSPPVTEESEDASNAWVKESANKTEPGSAFAGFPLTKAEERNWAMLAHLSILLNLVTGFLGAIAALVIYFAYKDRSRFVAYHAMQSFIFQSITWLGAGLIAAINLGIGTVFAFLIIPLLCLIPGILVLLLLPVSLIYGIVGAVQVNNGEDFRYWQVGDWVRGILEPKQPSQEKAQ